MLKLELYKIFKRKLVWIVFLGVFLLVIISDAMYIKNFCFNSSERNKLQYQLEKFESYKGKLTDERLEEFIGNYIQEEYDYLHDFMDDGKAVPVKKLFPHTDFDIHFGYFKLWALYFGDFTKYIKYICAFIVVAFSPIFSYEKESGMQEILLSTKNGRRKCTRAKVAAAFLVTNVMYLLVIALGLPPIFILTKGIGADTSIQMTPWLMSSQLNINYLTMLLHAVFMSFIAINVILLITLCVSFLAKNPMVSMCVCMGVLLALRPDVMATHVNIDIINKITSISPLNAIDCENLADQLPITIAGIKIQWIYIVEVLYCMLLAGGGIFFTRVLTRNQKYYAS
ncbi:MAG: ABC transporter permease subunit [Lachnospiraceae bacterium]|nr:ABC transporter permease subunit [Lachnospiraceae bacterium]